MFRFAIACVVAAALLAPVSCTRTDAKAQDLATVVLSIEGMSCGEMCPQEIEGMLESVDGVTDARVDFPTRMATVHARKGVAPDALAAAVVGAYSATVAAPK